VQRHKDNTIHTYAQTRTHTLSNSYTHTHTHTRTNKRTYTHMHRHAHTHSHTHTHAHAYTHIHTHAHTHTHPLTHIHTHTRTITHTHTHPTSNPHTHTDNAPAQGVEAAHLRLDALKSAASSSGVTSVHILALEPLAPESAHNINSVLQLLRLERLNDIFPEARLAVCVDLKMAQFLLGKRASSARYACLFCLFSDNPNHSHPVVEPFENAVTFWS